LKWKVESQKIKDSEIEDLKKKKKKKKKHLAVKVCFILYKKGHIQMNFPKF